MAPKLDPWEVLLKPKMLPNSNKVSQGIQSGGDSIQNGAIEDARGSDYPEKSTRKATVIMRERTQEVKNYNCSSLPVNVPIHTEDGSRITSYPNKSGAAA